MKIRPFREYWHVAGIMYGIPILVAIIAVLSVIASGYLQKSRVEKTAEQIVELSRLVEQFKKDCGFFPTTSQGLSALYARPLTKPYCVNWKGPYLKSQIVKDSWGGRIQYQATGNKFLIKSLGRDRREGGTGYDRDISSDDLR